MEKEEKRDARREGLLRLHEPKLIELNPSNVRNNAKAWFSAVFDFLTYWRLEDLLTPCYNVGVDIEVVKNKEYDEDDDVQQDYINLMMRHVHYAAGHFAVKKEQPIKQEEQIEEEDSDDEKPKAHCNTQKDQAKQNALSFQSHARAARG